MGCLGQLASAPCISEYGQHSITEIKIKMKLNKTIICAVLAIAAVTAGGVKAAIANAHIVTYYSDATLDQVVGERGHGCQSIIKWGETSPYSTVEDFSCF